MTKKQREEITKMSKEFASGFEPEIPLNGSGGLIVDPLSAFLSACGYDNYLMQVPESENTPMVLIMLFDAWHIFIPAAKDLNIKGINNWAWLDQKKVDLLKKKQDYGNIR